MDLDHSVSTPLQTMRHWWQGSEGSALLQAQSSMIEPWLARCFGYHALHLCPGDVLNHPLAGVRIPHTFTLNPCCAADVRARFEALPLQAESVDLVVMQHVLELAQDARALLREVDRVLLPEGRVVLMCFNPLSYWGLRNSIPWSNKAPWLGKAPSHGRLRDWLVLLGYEIEDTLWMAHGCRMATPGRMVQRWQARLMPQSGMVQLLLARKRVSMPAAIRHRWRLMPVLGATKVGNVVGQVRSGTDDEATHVSRQ